MIKVINLLIEKGQDLVRGLSMFYGCYDDEAAMNMGIRKSWLSQWQLFNDTLHRNGPCPTVSATPFRLGEGFG